MESLVTWFTSTLGAHISREAVVFIISLFPILELRGGILASSLLDITMWKGILISAVGNIIPIPFILFFIKKIFAAMKKTKLFRPLVEKMENKAMKKRDQIEKYEFWGLVLFVGIPPVSYTHLDVYKRQCIYYPDRCSFPGSGRS